MRRISTALRSGQEDLPTGLIGERLGAIQKAHPAEYASGTGRRRSNRPART